MKETKTFTCEVCSKSFTRNSSMTRHLRSVHSQPSSFSCVCGKSFGDKAQLKNHITGMHSYQTPWKSKSVLRWMCMLLSKRTREQLYDLQFKLLSEEIKDKEEKIQTLKKEVSELKAKNQKLLKFLVKFENTESIAKSLINPGQ